MIWSAISKYGTAELYSFPPRTTMNGELYVELLQEKLVVHMTILQRTLTMHDAAPYTLMMDRS